MPGQPANTNIKIYRSIRGYRQNHRHESVEALTKKLRPLILSVPGEEILSGVLTRDTSNKDFSPYMGEGRFGATRGMPIVVGLKDTVNFGDAVEQISGADFPVTIGGDQFIVNSADTVSDNDLHGDAQDL